MKTLLSFLNKKISSPIGIIVIVFFALFVGGFLFWQCQIVPEGEIKIPEIKRPEKEAEGEIADWKTYRNEGFGFEIKFPKEWNTDAELEGSSVEYPLSMSSKKETLLEALSLRLSVNLYVELGVIPPQSLYEGEEIVVEGMDLTPSIYSLLGS